MFVACSTLCFARQPLEEALHTIRLLAFAKADLALHDAGPHWKPADVANGVGKAAQKLKAANVPFAAFHLDFTGVNEPDSRDQLKAVCRLARILSVPLVTLPAADAGQDLDAEVVRLRSLVQIAEADGVIMTVETRAGTVTADPVGAAELCRRVPGLGLTLDPSYYTNGEHGPQNYDPLFQYVRHVRLRDTGKTPEQFQVRVGQGEIEYGRIVTQLERFRYDRSLSVDVRDVADNPFPVEPEVRKLKYLLESLV